MNTYEITFTRENGSTGKDRVTAANEKQARKDFREIYRHSSATITDITIDPAAVDPEDVEMLQDMVVAAVNEALRAASEAANARMNAVMGGMKIPGLM